MAGLFRWLPKTRWLRWLVLGVAAGAFFITFVVTLVITAVLLWQNPKVQGWVMVKILQHQATQPGATPPAPHLSPAELALLSTNAVELSSAGDLFGATNIWDVSFRFTSNQWAQMGPHFVPPIIRFVQPDGSVILRNPQAPRNGLAGVFGLDFPWSEAAMDFGNRSFNRVAIRFKGNGTFLDSQGTFKRPFKVELSRGDKSQKLAGRGTFNFHNLTADPSCLSDTMAYEFFRDAGVPAPRTTLARLRLSIAGRFQDRLLGVYVIVENPDAEWAKEQFKESGVALFKPVTYELFKDLGDDWKAYERIYDPKTKVKPTHTERLIALARLVTHGSDSEFEQRIGDFIDLDEFARFLACEVILSNYDGLLSNGQNFLLYLDPTTDRFGFVPWDLDHCWGEFPFIGTIEQRERASIWHPWVGENRFLERMLDAKPVAERYREQLKRIRETLFDPARLNRRLDELVPVVRPFVAEESGSRLARFERKVADSGIASATTTAGHPQNKKQAFSLKRFFVARAEAVTDQLEGRAEGVIITRRGSR
ncbi:MAG TPA: CotH kinase family protein [Verrucomicrobiae bacterium]|nr:CotH kinase family protein [Verrucomicrobiae bacterium]